MLKQRLLMAAAYGTPPVGGNLYSFGPNNVGATAQNTTSGTTLSPTACVDSHNTWTQISVSSENYSTPAYEAVMAIQSNGTLWSWGANYVTPYGQYGQIGQGASATNILVPTQVTGATNWNSVSQNIYGGLGTRSDGTLWSWGIDSGSGELGQGASANPVVPTRVGVLTTWAKVFSGISTTFIIDTSGQLWGLGNNNYYNMGQGSNTPGSITTPILISSASWVFISASQTGTIGIQSNGTAWSWGTDSNGELCNGVGTSAKVPTQIGVATNWTYAATNSIGIYAFSFLINSLGQLWTAGNNANYSTGRGTNSGNTATLTQITGASNWSTISTFSSYSSLPAAYSGAVARRTDNTIWSWGTYTAGAAGQGAASGTITTPTQITGANFSYLAPSKGYVTILHT